MKPIVEEYVTIDDNLPVAEALGADWEDTRLFRFKEGQSEATESAGDSEADEGTYCAVPAVSAMDRFYRSTWLQTLWICERI